VLFDESKIVDTVVAGFIGWAVHGLIQFYLTKSNVRAYLKIAINSLLDEMHNDQRTLTDYFENEVAVGKVPLIAPNHPLDDLESIGCIKAKAIDVLSECEIERLANFVFAAKEMDSLLGGFCGHLIDCEKREKQVSQHLYQHLEKHIKRIGVIGDQLPRHVSSISDLPREYHFNLSI